MRFFSQHLRSTEFVRSLKQDVARASVCRFLVAYVSEQGLDEIGWSTLQRVLRDKDSFGVSSLSCSCGFQPLLKLQSGFGSSLVRLKYFMDPLVEEADEPAEFSLFHSKLVYLHLREERKSVVYVGSHNWTARGLGAAGKNNVEASLRFEDDFHDDHLNQSGSSIFAEVNRHLRAAWENPLCLDATVSNRGTFDEWYAKGCKNAPRTPLDEVVVISCVLQNSSPTSPSEWNQLEGSSIYLQSLVEEEGGLVWNNRDRILVLVWNSESDLHDAVQPMLLRCSVSSEYAGPKSKRHGKNTSSAPMAGFRAVIWDSRSSNAIRRAVPTWSGQSVQALDFEFPTHRPSSKEVDGTVVPLYRFFLEVERVVFPASSGPTREARAVWRPESLAVADRRDDIHVERPNGYRVDPELREAMLDWLKEMGVTHGKVLPVLEDESARQGKRLAKHPLHRTFIPPESHDDSERFYQAAQPQILTADLDGFTEIGRSANQPVPRVQRVFTSKLDVLTATWMRAATELFG